MMQPLHIFIVEDEAILLMQLEELLENAGHHVVGTAMSAAEAISGILTTIPDLLLVDLHLQDGSSGVDVAKAVSHLAEMTMVFVTANIAKLPEDLEGAAAAIAKPFSDKGMTRSIAYLAECVRRPPPALDLPAGMLLAPSYLAWMDGLR